MPKGDSLRQQFTMDLLTEHYKQAIDNIERGILVEESVEFLRALRDNITQHINKAHRRDLKEANIRGREDILEYIEINIERFIPGGHVIGTGVKFPEGRVDILVEDRDKNIVAVIVDVPRGNYSSARSNMVGILIAHLAAGRKVVLFATGLCRTFNACMAYLNYPIDIILYQVIDRRLVFACYDYSVGNG